jgi:hypothetical protein
MSVTIHIARSLAEHQANDGLSLKGLEGIITVREWPDFLGDDADEFEKWRASLTQREWDRYLMPVIVEGKEQDYAHNLLTTDGITSVLKNIAYSSQAQLEPITQILSVGNGIIGAVARADTAVIGDAFGTNCRRAPNASTFIGNQVDNRTDFLSGDAQSTWTNVGFYGYNYGGSANATTAAGTGTLKTHSLFTYAKGATAVSVDYIFVLNN